MKQIALASLKDAEPEEFYRGHMENECAKVLYFIQQDGPKDPHPAVFRMRKPVGGTWEAHYWDWRNANWHKEEDIVRQYWNGFDPDVTKVSEAEAKARIADHSINRTSERT